MGGWPPAEPPFMSRNRGCESPLPPRTVGDVVGVSSSPSKVYVAPIGERGREPVAGDRARLWERLKSRRERKGDVFFSLLGRCGTWRGECAETGSGVVLPELCVPSVIMVGREGDAFLLFRWKPDRKRSIVRAGRRCDTVKVVMSGVFASERRPLVGRTEWDATAADGAAGKDRGVAIQDKGREKRLLPCRERLRRGSMREKYSSGRRRPAIGGAICKSAILGRHRGRVVRRGLYWTGRCAKEDTKEVVCWEAGHELQCCVACRNKAKAQVGRFGRGFDGALQVVRRDDPGRCRGRRPTTVTKRLTVQGWPGEWPGECTRARAAI